MARVMVIALALLGAVLILIGLGGGAYLANWFSQPTLGDDEGLTMLEIGICGEFALIHAFFGMCGIGIAQVIEQTRPKP